MSLYLDRVVDLAGGVARLRCEMGRAADEWLSKEFGRRRCEQAGCGGFGEAAGGAEAEPPVRGQGGKGAENRGGRSSLGGRGALEITGGIRRKLTRFSSLLQLRSLASVRRVRILPKCSFNLLRPPEFKFCTESFSKNN